MASRDNLAMPSATEDGRRSVGMSAEGRKEQSHAATAEPSARVVAAAFVAFVAVWSAYFAISEIATAIHNDMAEAYVWGQEFQLGYNQHPPFFAWIAGLWFLVFPRAGWAFAILSTINAGNRADRGMAAGRSLRPRTDARRRDGDAAADPVLYLPRL